MAYLLSSICAKNYWNRTTIVEIIVFGWVVSFFETQCRCSLLSVPMLSVMHVAFQCWFLSLTVNLHVVIVINQ